MDKIFEGKRALVTGAGKGIGRATAVKLAELGATVIGLSRIQADLDELQKEVVAKGMIARGSGGAIVNVSSISGKLAVKEHSVYCSSKAALDMLTMALAVELGPHKIRVNSANPTVDMMTMGDPVKAEPLLTGEDDVLHMIVHLLSDKASMANGVLVPVDSGSIVRL